MAQSQLGDDMTALNKLSQVEALAWPVQLYDEWGKAD